MPNTTKRTRPRKAPCIIRSPSERGLSIGFKPSNQHLRLEFQDGDQSAFDERTVGYSSRGGRIYRESHSHLPGSGDYAGRRNHGTKLGKFPALPIFGSWNSIVV